MRIGIDARSIQESAIHRGIGKYFVSLLRSLSKIDNLNTYLIFLYSEQASFALTELPHNDRFNFVFVTRPPIRTKKFIRTFMIGRERLAVDTYKLDALLQLDRVFPIRTKRTKIVSLVHDLIPQLFKEQYQVVRLRHKSLAGVIIYLKELRLRQLTNRAMLGHDASDKIIAISEHTAKDLVRLSGMAARNIVVVPHGAETIADGTVEKRPKALPRDRQFIFYVGGVDPRKRLELLVDEYATLLSRHPDLLLVLAGKEATNPLVPQAVKLQKKIRSLGLDKNVILTGYAVDEELLYLYQHAQAFVLASRYEGFGMPVLEAFQAGCPVVAYDNSSIPEVAGDAALLVPDGEPLAPAIEKLLNDKKLRDTLIKKGKSQAKLFTWDETARKTLKVLEEA